MMKMMYVSSKQSIEHLLWECVSIKLLWEMVEQMCDFKITFD